MDARLTYGRKIRSISAALCIWLLFGCIVTLAQTPQEKAWEVLREGLTNQKVGKRAAAVRALGLVQADPHAVEFAEKALRDRKPSVRAAAATALGQMEARSSIPLLKEALKDNDNRVFFAAADSLLGLGDPSGYNLYYEVLTGEHISGVGLWTEKKRLVTDPSAMTLMLLGVGIGFAPYATYGWRVMNELFHDYKTPVRVQALSKLASDSDPRTGKALVKAASDEHSTVRSAALVAIARHGDPNLVDEITLHMTDKNATVRYSAAAAVLRLSALVSADDTSYWSGPPLCHKF